MRILAVSNQFPLPLDAGGPLRIHGLARAIAESHEVHLLALSRASTTAALVQEMSETIHGPVEVFDPSPVHSFVGRWVSALGTGVPTYIRAEHSDSLARRLRALAPTAQAVVFLDDYAAGYAGTVAGVAPVVVDKSNILGWSIMDEPEPDGIREQLRRVLATHLVRRFERDCVRNADGVTATSQEEGQRLEELYGRAADAIVPSGVDVPGTASSLASTRTVGWLGDHRYGPNVEGLVRFVREGWEPLGNAGCKLVIPGREPPPEVRALKSYPGVELIGFVDPLEDLFIRLSAAVVPLWRGAGVKLKTLTFMAAGVPVAATPVALEGLAAENGRDCIVAEHPQDLANALRKLIDEPSLAQAIGQAGRRFVSEFYTWGTIGPRFAEVVEQVAMAP